MKLTLILTNTRDTSTDWVVDELRRRGRDYIRINTDLAHQLRLSFDLENYKCARGAMDLRDLTKAVGTIYVRRPDPPLIDYSEDPDGAKFTEFVQNQWRAMLLISPVKGIESLVGDMHKQELDRRGSITTRAQSALASTAFFIAALSMLSSLLANFLTPDARQTLLSHFPIWAALLAVTYLTSAFVGSLRAIHIQNYLLFEIKELQSTISDAIDMAQVGNMLRGKMMAASEANRGVALRAMNYVEAALRSLRNFVVLLIIAPAAMALRDLLSPIAARIIACLSS